MSIYFVLAAMLFCHVIDDYVLQAPCLCNLKQKSFWEKNAPEEQYKKDYIVALAVERQTLFGALCLNDFLTSLSLSLHNCK